MLNSFLYFAASGIVINTLVRSISEVPKKKSIFIGENSLSVNFCTGASVNHELTCNLCRP